MKWVFSSTCWPQLWARRGSFNPLSQGSPRLLWLATIKNHSCPAESARHQWDTGHFLYRVWTEFGPVVVRKNRSTSMLFSSFVHEKLDMNLEGHSLTVLKQQVHGLSSSWRRPLICPTQNPHRPFGRSPTSTAWRVSEFIPFVKLKITCQLWQLISMYISIFFLHAWKFQEISTPWMVYDSILPCHHTSPHHFIKFRLGHDA